MFSDDFLGNSHERWDRHISVYVGDDLYMKATKKEEKEEEEKERSRKEEFNLLLKSEENPEYAS